MSYKIPAKNMIPLKNDLLPGDIILLWRINFGTFTNQSVFPRYFAEKYGIDAPANLRNLVSNGFVGVQGIYDSLEDFATVVWMREVLAGAGVSGLSKENRNGLLDLLEVTFSKDELEAIFETRGYFLTDKGEEALRDGQEVVDRHPKKKF